MRREVTAVFTLVLALVSIGTLMIYSARAYQVGATEPQTHLYALAIGFVAMLVAARFDYHRLRDGVVFRGIVLLSVILLVVVLVKGSR